MSLLAPITMLIFLLLIVALLISIGVFVYKDAPKHGMDPLVWTLISILVPNLIGFIIYLVVRSSNKDTHKCPNCNNTVKNDYVKCPYCGTMLKNTCSNCGKAVQNDWDSCPYCSSQIDKSSTEFSGAYSDINYTYSENKKNGNTGLKVIIGIVITLVVLFFIIIAVNFVSFNSFKNSSNISIMESSNDVPIKVNELLGKGSKATMKSSYRYWDGSKEKNITVFKGGTLKIFYSSKVEDGELEINLYDSRKKLIESFPTNDKGTYSLTAEDNGDYLIEVVGKKTKGNYSIEIEKID
ncbi:hypothetical protein SH2C18_45950 [Clostridium sediminicola]|uniref:zinc ribbon domain-containing protein n=1 Tax=Clostridium sediminicola TaxID=3114879 RepID=UPI0031F26794